jgi:hypothetical protein
MRLSSRVLRRYVTAKDVDFFFNNGYVVFKGYIPKDVCEQAMTRIDQIIKEQIAL